MSSCLPWFLVPDDGVENGKELSHRGDDGNDVRLAGLDKTIAEGLEHGIVPDGDEGGHEGDGAHAAPAAADDALAAPFAGLPRPWRRRARRIWGRSRLPGSGISAIASGATI